MDADTWAALRADLAAESRDLDGMLAGLGAADWERETPAEGWAIRDQASHLAWVDDAAVTASVKTKIVADKAANLTRIDVDTNRGTVYLTGSVDTAEQKARAEQLARQASGVKGVVNNLQVVQKR